MTVRFVDVVERRQHQNELRKELICLIGDDPYWWKQDNETTRRIQEIGQMLGADSMEESRPLDAIDPESFTFAEYKALVTLGYNEKSIYEALGFKSSSMWLSWRKEQGFYIPSKGRRRKFFIPVEEDTTHGKD